MQIFKDNTAAYKSFADDVEKIIKNLSFFKYEKHSGKLKDFKSKFEYKTAEFFRENRKLNIGVIGQVKAGKSSFLNTLLFDGREILPKASTPKTATLTKMEYSEENIIEIEYYAEEEWEVIADNARIDMDDEIYTSARELVNMARNNGIDPAKYLAKGTERIKFDTYEDLILRLNDYVGENGKFTPIVKAVTLFLNKEEFKGLSIVDTPGLNDPIVSRTIRTKEFMEVCDVVFFLSQSGSFLDKSDWILLSAQLPQKGVKKLVLVASKYDSGVRDVLREHDEFDDIFGEDENTADNVPQACRIIESKLTKRARQKVREFTQDLAARGSMPELIEVIKQCEKPVLVSSIAQNMAGKSTDEYNSEEKNIYHAISRFSDDVPSDLKLLGNFDKVREIFDSVAEEKERILEEKSSEFIPKGIEELKGILGECREYARQTLAVLSSSDKDKLTVQKNAIEKQIESIRADIREVFSELYARLENEKAEGLRELRSAVKDYTELKTRTGTRTVTTSYRVSDSKWYKPWTWGKSHREYSSHTEHYDYCLAADAIENLQKYTAESVNMVEEIFTDAIDIKRLKRRLLDMIVNNFDTASESYDTSFFRIIVGDAIAKVEFPVFKLNISDRLSNVSAKFTGELTSASERNDLATVMNWILSDIFAEISEKLSSETASLKNKMQEISNGIESSLLEDILAEFNGLIKQCENKDAEIEEYKKYISAIDGELSKL